MPLRIWSVYTHISAEQLVLSLLSIKPECTSLFLVYTEEEYPDFLTGVDRFQNCPLNSKDDIPSMFPAARRYFSLDLTTFPDLIE